MTLACSHCLYLANYFQLCDLIRRLIHSFLFMFLADSHLMFSLFRFLCDCCEVLCCCRELGIWSDFCLLLFPYFSIPNFNFRGRFAIRRQFLLSAPLCNAKPFNNLPPNSRLSANADILLYLLVQYWPSTNPNTNKKNCIGENYIKRNKLSLWLFSSDSLVHPTAQTTAESPPPQVLLTQPSLIRQSLVVQGTINGQASIYLRCG